MKKWFVIFIYLSLLFLIYTLAKGDYLNAPDVQNRSLFTLSIIIVCLGFVFDAFAWYKTLLINGFERVTPKVAIVSMGLSVFGKYIPGKIWTIVGRSAYIAKTYKYPEKELVIVSLNAQFLSLWIGLLFGSLIGFFYNFYWIYVLSIFSFWVFLTTVLFTSYFHNLLIIVLKRIFKYHLQLPQLSFSQSIKVIPWFLVNWFLWCFGFYLFSQSIIAEVISPVIGLVFALAAIVGLLVVFVPGGIGVREGVIAGILIYIGLDPNISIAISVGSRIWFLIGEFFLFIVSLVLMKKIKS